MRQADLEEMRALTLFEGVADRHVEAMLKAAFLQRFPPMVELVRDGEPADFLHIIVEGQVEVYAAYGDRETTIAVQESSRARIHHRGRYPRSGLSEIRTRADSGRIPPAPAEAVRTAFRRRCHLLP